MALVNSFDSIIFDYGGVLVAHQTEADQAPMAEILALPVDRFSELYWATRADYDKEALTAVEYWTAIAQRANTALTPDMLNRLIALDAAGWMHFDEPMWEWIDQLKKAGKQVAILSNMPRELGEALKGTTSRLDVFDQITLSYEVRAAKPEPAIYEFCLEGLGVTPERAIFFDDRIENVQGAELLGIRAMQFLDRDALLLQVRA